VINFLLRLVWPQKLFAKLYTRRIYKGSRNRWDPCGTKGRSLG